MPNIYGLKPGQRAKRWSHKAYGTFAVKSRAAWKPADENFLKREFTEFNRSPAKPYWTFLKQVAYSLEKTKSQVRQKLIELNRRGVIGRRTH